MNPLDNRYERNPALHRDMPQDLFTDQGELRATLYGNDFPYGDGYPCLLPYKIDGAEFTINCAKVKTIWQQVMVDDIRTAIDRKFGNHFLSRKDLNLNIIGL